MSVDQSHEEDCTVYIEELKSDNASLKLNAATKISLIATVLGHNRIRDELIPYLIQIIQQMDNDNDFLIKVAEGLFQLKSFCNNNKQISILIHPLKILASLDQPAVREQAITCLKKLAEDCDKDFHEAYLVPLIKQLSAKNQAYSPRVVACCLIPITYPKVNQKLQEDLRKIFRQLALQQNSPLVRRALAQNIEAYAKVITKSLIKSDLFQIWQAFIVDQIDIIRIKALECAHVVARAFKKQENAQKFLKFIKIVDPNKRSWRIRYSLIESLANMLNYLDKQTIKKEVIQVFEELLKDSQAQVRSIALLKTPQLAQKLSSQQSFTVLFQYFEKAMKDGTKDTPPTVKLALVEAIVPYFKTLQMEKITENGIPIISSLLKQENLIVRIGIVSRLKDLHEVLGKQNTVKYLVPIIQGVLTDKKWRFKLAIAENIFSLFKTLGYDDYKQFFDKVLTTYLKDHNYAVREQTIKCLVQLKQVFNRDVLQEIISKYTNQFIADANNIYRITALNILHQAGTNQAIDKKAFNQLYLAIIQKLSTQKVPNVYIVFFTMYPKIKSLLNGNNKKQYQSLAKKVQSNNGDQDVLYYIQKSSE